MTTHQGKQNATLTFVLTVVLLAAVFMFVRFSMNRTAVEPPVSITETELTIGGMYGRSYLLSTVQSVALVEGTPILGRKINGAGLNSRKVYRGIYVVEGLGNCRVFLFGDPALYIQMVTEEETVLIMFSERQKTTELYNTIQEQIL